MVAEKPSDAFKDRLRIARETLRGMSQVELAKATGLPPSSIAHFEGGGRKPSFDNLRKLANALNVTTDYLLGRVDEPDMAQAADPSRPPRRETHGGEPFAGRGLHGDAGRS